MWVLEYSHRRLGRLQRGDNRAVGAAVVVALVASVAFAAAPAASVSFSAGDSSSSCTSGAAG